MGLALDLTGTTVGGLAREISGHLNDTYQQEITVQDLDEAIAIVRAEDEEHDYTICVLKRRKTPADDTAG
jgi:hypothetical protein